MKSASKKDQFSYLTTSICRKIPSQDTSRISNSKSNQSFTKSKYNSILSPYSLNRDALNEKYIIQSLKKKDKSNIIYSFQYNQLHTGNSLADLEKKKYNLPRVDSSSLISIENSNIISEEKHRSSSSIRDRVKEYLHPKEEADASWEEYLNLSEHFDRINQKSKTINALMNGKSNEKIQDERTAIARDFAAKTIKKIVFRKASESPQPSHGLSKSPHGLRSSKLIGILDKLKEEISTPSTGRGQMTSPRSMVKSSSRYDLQAREDYFGSSNVSARNSAPKQFLIRKSAGRDSETTNNTSYQRTPSRLEDMSERLRDITQDYSERLDRLSSRHEYFKGIVEKNQKTPEKEKEAGKKGPNKELMIKFARIIKRCAAKLKTHHLTVDEALQRRIFTNKPFGRKGAEAFIKACKEGDYDEVYRLLNRNRYLMFDFDWTNQTGLHWAVLRGHELIVELLIRWKCNVNAPDVAGKTPLMLAARSGNLELVKLLLENGADPTLKSDGNKLASDYTEDDDIRLALRKAIDKRNAKDSPLRVSRANTMKK